MPPRPLLIAVYLVGRPWTVWIVGAVLILAMQAKGAGGFDAVILATGPAFVWMGISWCCRTFIRYIADPLTRSTLPSNPSLPAPQLAVIVVADCNDRDGQDHVRMVERLPDDLSRIMRPKSSE